MFLRSSLVAAVLVAVPATALASDGLTNPSFEKGTEGWDVALGARNDGGGSTSQIERDTTVKRVGDASLRCSGTASTSTWNMLTQAVEVHPGDLVSLRVAARCEGVVRQGHQFGNANGLVLFENAAGQRTGFFTTGVMQGDREWVDLGLDVRAPAGTVRAKVGVFHSMSGTTWFDDVRFSVTPTAPFDSAARGAALDALEADMRRSYSFWGLDGKPEPGALFARHREACVAAADEAAFAAALRDLLAELDDVHCWIDTPFGRIGTSKPGAGAAFPLQAVLARLSEKVVHGRNVLAGWIGEGADRVGYLLVASFALPDEERQLVEKAFDTFRGAKALIIDVRPNGGGDERQAMAIGGRFTPSDVVYARNVFRDPTLAGLQGLLPATDRVLTAAPEASRFSGKVAVLAGPGCVSSTEGFLLMCKALPNVTIVGRPSRGASGNPAGLELADGVTVWTSRWRTLDLTGECTEGRGVAPDVVVEPEGVTRTGLTDPVLDRAVELLRE